MYAIDRSLRFVRGALLSYGPSIIKKRFWDREYSNGQWDFIDDTAGDCVYPVLEAYAQGGSILDLGCGPGNTANELHATAYSTYVGVDISDSALDKARRRSGENGRADKNTFVRADFLTYAPARQFDVILLRESLYHVPLGKVAATLERYSAHLALGGVFIVRLYTGKSRPDSMVSIIQNCFDVLERREHAESMATVIVFRPANLSTSEAVDLAESDVVNRG